VQIFHYDQTRGAYAINQHDFGDPTPRLADLNGDRRQELVSADDRFAYEFTSYAFSGLPLQVWSFSEGRLQDVTRAFPGAVSRDATAQLRRFRSWRRQGLGLGFIAAWAADEDLLGRRAAVQRLLGAEARRHRLRSSDRLSPGGYAFIGKLDRFLRSTGYS
jgi:hypothetical protein